MESSDEDEDIQPETFQKFWLVMRADLSGMPTVRHATKQKARAEAERLCKKHRKQFILLEVIAAVDVDDLPVRWREGE